MSSSAGGARPTPALSQAIGRLALIGLVLNVTIGSSVFGLPSVIAERLGTASPWAWVVAACGMALIVACIAEVASRFNQAGGQYLYARVAFGRLAGIEMAWLAYLVRLTAAATNANLFVIYLGEFWPGAIGAVESRVVLALLILPLALANYRGVGAGLTLSNGFIVAKLFPLTVFVLAGLIPLLGSWVTPVGPAAPATSGTWLQVVLLLVFAYGGFEAALFPMSEAKNARRDAPTALFAGLAVCTLVYTLVQAVVVATLSDPGASPRPLAAAAQTFLGPAGATLMALGALVSVYGYLTGAMLVVPRLTYAAAEQRDLPPLFGAVHPRFRTPYISVVVFATLTWALAAASSFLQNLTLSAVSRLLTYGALCLAVLVLRRKERRRDGVGPAVFRVPGGAVAPLLGLAFTGVLALRMTQRELLVLAATLAVGLIHWATQRRMTRDSTAG